MRGGFRSQDDRIRSQARKDIFDVDRDLGTFGASPTFRMARILLVVVTAIRSPTARIACST